MKPHGKKAVKLGYENVTRLLNEAGISARVLWEGLLLPVLGLRPAGALYVPGELPDAGEIMRSVGQLFTERVQLGSGRGSTPVRFLLDRALLTVYRLILPPAFYRAKVAEMSFNDILEKVHSYQAHLSWAETLGLRVYQVSARPNAREVFFFADPATRRQLEAATAVRHRVRRRTLRHLDAAKVRTFMVYPEELSPEYVELMGKVLGYPECCIKAYIHDRQNESFYPEVRAARQLGEVQVGPEPPYAYFARNFVPCRPDCPEASAIGRRAAASLQEVDPRLGRAYLDGLVRNREAIRRAPELIAKREKVIAAHLGQAAEAGSMVDTDVGTGEEEP